MAVTISKPTVNGSNNTWGTTINSGLDTIANAFNGVIQTTPDLGAGFKIDGTTVNVGSAELDLLDGATAATVVNDKVVVYGDEGQVKVNQVFEAVTLTRRRLCSLRQTKRQTAQSIFAVTAQRR